MMLPSLVHRISSTCACLVLALGLLSCSKTATAPPPPPSVTGRSCNPPVIPSELISTAQAQMILAYGKAFGPKNAAPGNDAPASAREVAELMAEMKKSSEDAIGRWTSCLGVINAVGEANHHRTTLACLDVVPVCKDPRGGHGCCPAACVQEHRALCAKHGCATWQEESKVLDLGLMTGRCVPGFEELAGSKR